MNSTFHRQCLVNSGLGNYYLLNLSLSTSFSYGRKKWLRIFSSLVFSPKFGNSTTKLVDSIHTPFAYFRDWWVEWDSHLFNRTVGYYLKKIYPSNANLYKEVCFYLHFAPLIIVTLTFFLPLLLFQDVIIPVSTISQSGKPIEYMSFIPTPLIRNQARSIADIMAGKASSAPKRKDVTVKKTSQKKLAIGSSSHSVVVLPPRSSTIIQVIKNLNKLWILNIRW